VRSGTYRDYKHTSEDVKENPNIYIQTEGYSFQIFEQNKPRDGLSQKNYSLNKYAKITQANIEGRDARVSFSK
jgi:hypothetical protein